MFFNGTAAHPHRMGYSTVPTPLPTTIEDARQMAQRIILMSRGNGKNLLQSQALDLVAQICGLKNWEALRAGLLRLEAVQMPAVERALGIALGLNLTNRTDAYRALAGVLAGRIPESAMTSVRADLVWQYLDVSLECSWHWANEHGAQLSADMLRASFVFGDGRRWAERRGEPYSFLPYLLDIIRWLHAERPNLLKTSRLEARVAAILPGFSMPSLLRGHPQSLSVRDGAAQISAILSRPLENLIDEVRMD